MDNLVLSQDGSHTVISEKFGVSYHSKYGAIQETQTVFIDAGLRFQEERDYSRISILEMGFGTGLNAAMTMLQAKSSIQIDYTTIEAYPLSEAQYSNLNYPDVLHMDDIQSKAFLKMHQSDSNSPIQLNDSFRFTKYLEKLEIFSTQHSFDIIYYDAFAPSSQEELWSQDMMTKLYHMCNDGAVLVTYCAKGSFKRALKGAGFEVEGIPGPIGKREMTRAHRRS